MFDAQLGRLVAVDAVDFDGRATVAVARGRAVDGARVTFVGEVRQLAEMAHAIEAGGPVMADVPDWAVLSVEPTHRDLFG